MKKLEMTWFDRLTLMIAPAWTLQRVQLRALAYEAASGSRRTAGWNRHRGDANATMGLVLHELRNQARNLLRNNGYAIRAQQVIVTNLVGWGILPRATGLDSAANDAMTALWRQWADTTECDADGQHTFAGLQALAAAAVVSDGEVLIRRRIRRPKDALSLPLQLQVLEIDFLDTSRTGEGFAGGPIINGVEFDAIGRRVAYWLFPAHPGAAFTTTAGVSRRVPASEILHLYRVQRPGAVRGASWLGAALVNLSDLDEYEDAELMKQKIAACFAAFVTDTEGGGSPLGTPGADPASGEADAIETFEPGMIHHLAPGRTVTVASPPQVTSDNMTVRTLRKVAAGLGITYEDLTGDYSQVNFSSARMGRIPFRKNLESWQSTMMIPRLCAPVWSWAVEAAQLAGAIAMDAEISAEWTVPPLPMIEPDKEIAATTKAIRAGLTTPSEAIREQGGDPETHWQQLAADMKRIRGLDLVLDSDPAATTQAGQVQPPPPSETASAKKPPLATDS